MPLLHDVEVRQNDKEQFVTQYDYVHPGFKGKTSIKYNMFCPVPQTSGEQKREFASALRQYCKLDTYAMSAIWKRLRGRVALVVIGHAFAHRLGPPVFYNLALMTSTP